MKLLLLYRIKLNSLIYLFQYLLFITASISEMSALVDVNSPHPSVTQMLLCFQQLDVNSADDLNDVCGRSEGHIFA